MYALATDCIQSSLITCVFALPFPLPVWKQHEGQDDIVYCNISSIGSSAGHMMGTQQISIDCVSERPFPGLLTL